MATDRSRRATLAFLLALMAATGLGLGATGLSRLVSGDALPGVALVAIGVGLVLSAFRWLRAINARRQ